MHLRSGRSTISIQTQCVPAVAKRGMTLEKATFTISPYCYFLGKPDDASFKVCVTAVVVTIHMPFRTQLSHQTVELNIVLAKTIHLAFLHARCIIDCFSVWHLAFCIWHLAFCILHLAFCTRKWSVASQGCKISTIHTNFDYARRWHSRG